MRFNVLCILALKFISLRSRGRVRARKPPAYKVVVKGLTTLMQDIRFIGLSLLAGECNSPVDVKKY